MKIISVVILYSSSIKNSDTLQSILECDTNDLTLDICIWNNGPQQLAESDIIDFLAQCEEKNINANIYQDTRNLALSKIYNHFITHESYDFITLLDQDSSLPSNYISNIASYLDADLVLPKIIVNKNGILTQTDPHFYGDINDTFEYGKIERKVDSVMSGLALSKQAVDKIIAFRDYVFEERLAFYGIDSDLFRIINIMQDENRALTIYCSNEIRHSFAMFNPEEAKSEFRIMEMFYFKYFIRCEYQKKKTISTLWVCIRDFIRGKINYSRMKNLIIFTLNKRHPRSKIIMHEHIIHSHSTSLATK